MNRLFLLLLLLLIASLSLNGYLLIQLKSEQLQAVINPITDHVINRSSPTSDSGASAPSQSSAVDSDSTPPPDDGPSTAVAHKRSLAAKANQLFEQQWYQQAIEVYEQLSAVDETAAITVKRGWLEQLRLQLKQQNLQRLNQFNRAIIDRFPYDLEFLTLYADTLAASNKPLDAIDQYHSLISYSFEQQQQEFYQARIHDIADQQFKQLEQQQAWQAMVNFSDMMIQQQPDYPPYVLAHAKALIETDQLELAQAMIEPLLEISFYRQQAETLLSEIDKRRLNQTAIRLQPLGEHYLVNGRINRTNPVSLMIDTGASLSLLTQSMFDDISAWTHPEYIRQIRLGTAGGVIDADIYRFEHFQINEFYLEGIEFVVVDLPDIQNYHGLLGMNFLKHFTFQLDQEENLLILSPK